MKRREFMATSCLVGLAPLTRVAMAGDPAGSTGKQYIELRLVQLESEVKQKAFCQFLRDAAIPAMNRIGIGPVGVFTFMEEPSPDLYVLIPHDSLESVATWIHRLGDDAEFLSAGAGVLDATKADPAYARMESSLLLAFDEMPKVEVPSKKETRIFQLRIYESHSVAAGQRKVEMFNTGGEIAVFRRTGLTPVFFGEALVGGKMPNVTYMLGFDDKPTSEKAWAAFRADPGWLALRADPYYKDTVSNITNLFLRPAACSQI